MLTIHSTIIKLSAHLFMSHNGLTFISKLCYAEKGFFVINHLFSIFLNLFCLCKMCILLDYSVNALRFCLVPINGRVHPIIKWQKANS